MDKKELVIMEAEEMIARLRLNIASGRKRMANLEFEREELKKSFPQWEEEIDKYQGEIEQVKGSNNKENK